jgi:hypothetical protein
MQRSEGAVKSLYHRTLLTLRDELAQMEQRSGAEQPRLNGRRRLISLKEEE